MGRLLLSPLKPSVIQGEETLLHQPLLLGQVLQSTLTTLVTLFQTCSSLPSSFLYWGVKSGHYIPDLIRWALNKAIHLICIPVDTHGTLLDSHLAYWTPGPHILFSTAHAQVVTPQLVLMQGVSPFRIQDFASVVVECHEVHADLFL